MHFWDADSSRKRIFRVLGLYCLPDFKPLISNDGKVLSNGNVIVSGQVKSENSSLPVAIRVSKSCVLKLPIMFSVF